ncbi:MAG: hypothetical protein WCS20_10490 [Alphaproteobacteria bacterium]
MFRVDTGNWTKRIELMELVTVNVKNGNIIPHGAANLAPADMAAIEDWLADRAALLAERMIEAATK